MTRQRRRALQIGAVATAFAAALALWVGGSGGDTHNAGSGSSGASPFPGAPTLDPANPSTPASSPSASGSRAPGATTDINFDNLDFLRSTSIRRQAPGPLHIEMRAYSDHPMRQVAYAVRGNDKTVNRRYWVASPMYISTSAPNDGKATTALGVQVSPEGGDATCSISINGTVVKTYTAHGPYRVVVCVA